MHTTFLQCILRYLYFFYACNQFQVFGVYKLITDRCTLAFVFPCLVLSVMVLKGGGGVPYPLHSSIVCICFPFSRGVAHL